MGWFTASDWLIVALFLLAPLTFVLLVERAERRVRRRWWRRYFQEGGLARTLIARWRGPPKLTDQRETRP